MADISTLDAVSDAVDGPREAEAQPGRNDTNQVDNENGAVAAPGGPPVQLASKPKKKSKSTMARGPTSLNKKCGTGFEGAWAPLFVVAETDEDRLLRRPTHESGRVRGREDSDLSTVSQTWLSPAVRDYKLTIFTRDRPFDEWVLIVLSPTDWRKA